MTHPIEHHLTDALLMAYSAGSLAEGFGLAVAAHLSMCDTCRARMGAFDSIGGALLERGAAPAMPAGSMAAALARAREQPSVSPVPRRDASLPAPLHDYIGGDLSTVRWRPVGMGVQQSILKTGPGATARLLRIPAGAAVPDHGHRGTELTLVLQGAFSDAQARFARGDIEIADQDLNHTPVADIGEDCICLAVTDAPLKFSGLAPRLVQRFLRI